MGIEDFLDHTCSIYHLRSDGVDAGFGIALSPGKSYEENAETGIACHFHVKSDGTKLVQEDPYSAIEGIIKLSLPAGTDIRLNDKVEWEETGMCYRAGLPRNIRGHHITVVLYRFDGLGGAI